MCKCIVRKGVKPNVRLVAVYVLIVYIAIMCVVFVLKIDEGNKCDERAVVGVNWWLKR